MNMLAKQTGGDVLIGNERMTRPQTQRSHVQQFPSIRIDGADCGDGTGGGPSVGKRADGTGFAE
jgi:hypothetical protein